MGEPSLVGASGPWDLSACPLIIVACCCCCCYDQIVIWQLRARLRLQNMQVAHRPLARALEIQGSPKSRGIFPD